MNQHFKAPWEASWTYTPSLQKQCFYPAKACLLDLKSIAFARWEQCSDTPRALLLKAGSNAFELQEQCSRPSGALLYRYTKHCSVRYRAMFCKVWSNALYEKGHFIWSSGTVLNDENSTQMAVSFPRMKPVEVAFLTHLVKIIQKNNVSKYLIIKENGHTETAWPFSFIIRYFDTLFFWIIFTKCVKKSTPAGFILGKETAIWVLFSSFRTVPGDQIKCPFSYRAVLWTLQNIALYLTEQCFVYI